MSRRWEEASSPGDAFAANLKYAHVERALLAEVDDGARRQTTYPAGFTSQRTE